MKQQIAQITATHFSTLPQSTDAHDWFLLGVSLVGPIMGLLGLVAFVEYIQKNPRRRY